MKDIESKVAKRWSMEARDGPGVYPMQEPCGDWILYDDHSDALSAVTAEAKRLLAECLALLSERDQIRAEVEALRRDAERYRWLRDQASLEPFGGWAYDLPTVDAWDCKPGPQLNEQFGSFDEAIDAAMAAKEGV